MHPLARLVLLLPLALLFACSESDTPIGGEAEETDVNVAGTWRGQLAGGQQFELRLNQRGAAVTGDIAIQGERTGLAGRINGNSLALEANFTPSAFLDADIQDNRLVNGRISSASGGIAGNFEAERL